MPQPRSTKKQAPAPAASAPPKCPDEIRDGSIFAQKAWVDEQTGIHHVEKSGYNSHHGYAYFQEHGLFALVKPLLAAAGLTFWPKGYPQLTEYRGDRAIVYQGLVLANARGETIEIGPFPAEGMDKQDKGTAKALTNGSKYLWQKGFGIATEEIDSDSLPAGEGLTKVDSAPAVIDELEAARIKQTVLDAGIDREKVKAKLAGLAQVETIAQLPAAKAAEFADWVAAQIKAQGAA